MPRELSPPSREVFDSMVERLVVLKLMQYKDADGLRKRLPRSPNFIPMPPRPKVLDCAELMSHVEWDGKVGVSSLDLISDNDYFKDRIPFPDSAYLTKDVFSGRDTLGMTPDGAYTSITLHTRLPYGIFQGIIHAILLPYFFATHNMWLVNARHGDGVADLWLCEGGKPKLSWSWAGNSFTKWGSASCGGIVVP